MDNSIHKLYFSLIRDTKLANVGQRYEKEVLIGTNFGDIIAAEIIQPSIVDEDRQLFSGKLLITANFLPFEILEDVSKGKVSSILKEATTEEIKEAILEENKAIEQMEQSEAFEEEVTEELKKENENLMKQIESGSFVKGPQFPDPKIFGGSQFINLHDLQGDYYCIGYTTPKEGKLIPLSTPCLKETGESYPLIFPKFRGAEYFWDAVKLHPVWGKSVSNFTIVPLKDMTELEGVYALLIVNGLESVRAIAEYVQGERNANNS